MTKAISGTLLVSFLLLPSIAAAAAGSPYMASNLGYDLSYNTLSYPTWFNFAILSVTRGKAFLHNERLLSEYSWVKSASSGTAPTLYMNLNAPYGSTVAGHVDGPGVCPQNIMATNTEPTACQGYNYGYNAAQDAYAYAQQAGGVESRLWWLDIEEANSWSKDPAVNGATIQGAIDFLNTQGIRAGIYSMPRMWKKIAGSNFVPTQAIGGSPASIPLWLPIGIKSQVNAINTCVTATGFIPGSPLWLVQYVANSKAIDQNVAC